MNIRHNLEAARMASFSANEKSAFVGKLLFCFHLMPNMNDFRRKSLVSMWLSVFCFEEVLDEILLIFLWVWVRGVGVVVVVVSDSLRVVV
jgi:hypothetical protein